MHDQADHVEGGCKPNDINNSYLRLQWHLKKVLFPPVKWACIILSQQTHLCVSSWQPPWQRFTKLPLAELGFSATFDCLRATRRRRPHESFHFLNIIAPTSWRSSSSLRLAAQVHCTFHLPRFWRCFGGRFKYICGGRGGVGTRRRPAGPS